MHRTNPGNRLGNALVTLFLAISILSTTGVLVFMASWPSSTQPAAPPRNSTSRIGSDFQFCFYRAYFVISASRSATSCGADILPLRISSECASDPYIVTKIGTDGR